MGDAKVETSRKTLSTSHFLFDAATFVAPGHELDPGEWDEGTRAEIATLRMFYPELSHWGDLAIGSAFSAMSQDYLSVGWADWMLEERNETFLDYCCWRQTRGCWKYGMADGLAEASEWRSNVGNDGR